MSSLPGERDHFNHGRYGIKLKAVKVFKCLGLQERITHHAIKGKVQGRQRKKKSFCEIFSRNETVSFELTSNYDCDCE